MSRGKAAAWAAARVANRVASSSGAPSENPHLHQGGAAGEPCGWAELGLAPSGSAGLVPVALGVVARRGDDGGQR